ncbi:MAG TPA: 2-C-methyl-D-erythritol 4-phosphate cytidylyltransferase [Vicinamibacterales bacterium]|nr:2-C-methyl-D-erythritol 4-phosphate cytidylyltransferase [Vicinamibacterales bacterium]
MHVSAIIAAGGRGARFGGTQPKQLQPLAGVPILKRTVDVFLNGYAFDEVVVALPSDLAANPPAYLDDVIVVEGGERRQDSVANAVRAVAPSSQVIVIHDAARPLVTPAVIERTIAAAIKHGAAIAALPARDTVKRGDASRVIRGTLPRDEIFLAQTPQAFRVGVLRDALAIASTATDATDEAMLAEAAGHHVHLVDGDPRNLKITTPDDLMLAEALAPREARPARTGRAGIGYDLHRLVEGRPLILGGVTIPSDRGALGHSDADVVCHAITDAVLGAASLGDIGRHFPDVDPRWKDASSLDLLRRAIAMLADEGLQVGNVDVTVILERPKIKDHIAAMRGALADALGVDVTRVSIKGKTNEGMDAIGRGEAIAAHAIALVRSR